jgi:acetyl esterase/lipase/lysophospholipase L1-like esterase
VNIRFLSLHSSKTYLNTPMRRKKLLFLLLLLAAISSRAQQKVIPLYSGPAPGSENWNWTAHENDSNLYHSHTVYNVSRPTITVYPADSTHTPTGTAVIVCPGGGLQTLSIMQEGYAVVKWLQQKGITAFLLRYRLMHTIGDDPYKEMLDKMKKGTVLQEQAPVQPLSIADARAAIAYVRAHAAEFGVSPSRVGIIGFSAGGTLSAATAYGYTPENKPDFVGAIYPYFPPAMQAAVPVDAPPLFITVASDDPGEMQSHSSVTLYEAWVKAKHSAEIHVYAKGGHGFGMNEQGLPTDSWKDRFADWLDQQGLITPAFPNKKGKQSAKQAADFARFLEYLLHNDWAVISHYQDKNDSIEAHLNPNEKRVVFMGNSITEGWYNFDPGFFTGRPYIDRGISGQTTPLMLVRFREDVIGLKPAVVVILAGINDIAQNTGPIPIVNTFGNIQSMAELAHASHIKVILSSVMPAATISWRPAIDPVQKIIDLNKMIKAYAGKMGYGYIDYYSAMVYGNNKAMNPKYTNEGLHPNLAGYKVIEPLAEKAIAEALKTK